MITDRSKAVLKQATSMAHDDIDAFAADIVVEVRDGGRTPYISGNLRDTCTHKTEGLVARVETQTAAKDGLKEGYGYVVHEGTSKQQGQPFFRWAFDAVKVMWK